ncbi:MAG: PAS domain S-box protein, partial [Euryarchaeota archaeon]|nr:PAS domain S-box protein [Euryarchaeota archaeon]
MSSKKQTNSEKKYRKLFEHSMDAAYITTPEGEVIDINPAGLEMFGYSRDEFLKLDVSDLYVDPPVREKALKALEDQGYLRNFEYELYRKDKSTVTVQENCTSVKDEGGRVSMYYGVLRNITHQKKLEKKLSTIYGLSKEMTLSRDTDEISKFVLNAAKKVLNFDICALLLLDDETNEIYVKNYYGYDKKIKDFRVSLDDPVGITAY